MDVLRVFPARRTGQIRQVQVRGQLLEQGLVFRGVEDAGAGGFVRIKLRYGVYAELPDLFRLSAGASNSAINLFFVGDIELSGEFDKEALSGGTPGPMGMHGTGSSGIAISTDMMLAANDPVSLGRTLAHEIGHFLGLFHTSEQDGRVFDPLPDTPECPTEMAAGDVLQPEDCEGAGNDNLMFWAKSESSALTGDQQDILRAALVLQ